MHAIGMQSTNGPTRCRSGSRIRSKRSPVTHTRDRVRTMAESAGHQLDIQGAKARLLEAGGYEIVPRSPGLELGVYVLVAPEPDRQQPHEDDEVYVVLEGRGTLEVEGERFD